MAKRAGSTRRRRKTSRLPDGSGRLLERLPAEPRLDLAVPQLLPEELHRLILDRGLEESGDLISLATPAQMAHLFDLDLWRPDRAGGDERFDGQRFGVWLEVLAAGGTAEAAATLAALDAPLVTAGMAQHVRVFDRAVVDPYISLAGEATPTGYAVGEPLRCDVGGYVVFGRRTDQWEAVTAVLLALNAGHGEYFTRVMRGCIRLSDAGREMDGLDRLLEDGDQVMFDLAVEREGRRDAQGYVTPARARAFLNTARRTAPAPDAAAQEPGLVPVGRDPDLLAIVNEGLAFLANTLIAGCSIQGRPLEPQEAAAAASAVCTLGFENWPAGQAPAPEDLATAFQIGWTRLHEQVCMYTADRLLAVLASLPRCDAETDVALRMLRAGLRKHLRAGTPWRVREALDVVAMLDTPSWVALRGLIDELPVLPAAVPACMTPSTHSMSATAFEFIASNAQVLLIHEFVESLGERLR